VTINRFLLLFAILVFGVGVWSVAQDRSSPPRPPVAVVAPAAPAEPIEAVVPVEAAPQVPETPPAPQAWSFAFGGENNNYLGVYAEPLTSENLGAYGLREARGVGIKQVIKDSPAEKAGLQKDDVILRFDSEPVTSIRKLNRLIDEAEPGHTAQLTISRRGAEQQVAVKLGKRTNSVAGVPGGNGSFELNDDIIRPNGRQFRINPPDGRAFSLVFGSNRRIGVGTSPLTRQLGEYFGVRDGGVLVSTVNENGPAAKAGVKAGDVITEVDGSRINSAADLIRELGKKKDGDVTLTIIRDKSQRSVKVTPDQSAPSSEFPNFEFPQVGELMPPTVQITPMPELRGLVVPRVLVAPRLITPKVRILPPPPPAGTIL
jgi:S1-C subfamily serine protease